MDEFVFVENDFNQKEEYIQKKLPTKNQRAFNYQPPEQILGDMSPFKVVTPNLKQDLEKKKPVGFSGFAYDYQNPITPSKKINFEKFKLKDFELGKKLGNGRFGEVYLAREIKKDYIVALKILRKEEIKKLGAEQMIVREINIHSFVDHPNIIKLYGFFHDQENVYLILEYAPDGDLYHELKSNVDQRMVEEEVVQIIRQVLNVFLYLQKNNIIHRDLKPENLLLSMGQIKLADFGWSVSEGQKRKTFCGTLDYVPPEMAEGKDYDLKSDNWAIGILTYELLVGKPPFEQGNQQQVLESIKTAKIQFPDFISEKAKNFISSLCKNDSQERMELHEALQHPFINKQFYQSHFCSFMKAQYSFSFIRVSNSPSLVIFTLNNQVFSAASLI